MKIVTAEGSYEQIGYKLGIKLEEEIRHNIKTCGHKFEGREIERNKIINYIDNYANSLSSSTIRMMEGLSRGSKTPFESLLRYNAIQDIITPGECTTFAAVGKATSDGKAVLLKNRDTSGNYKFKGPFYHENREVSVAIAIKTSDNDKIIGSTKAGSTGIMMGMNKNLAVASNFGALEEVTRVSKQDLTGISGRPQMLREALECNSAKDAADLIIGKLTKSPMATPGIVFLVDFSNIFVIEGGSADDMFAVQHITDGVAFRSNHFHMLDQLNDTGYVSALCRKMRAEELVKQNYGNISKKKLLEFSMDHQNGPGDNSICRHGMNPEDSATVSASIMVIDGENPEKSAIDIALGSPCWSWRNKDGHISIQMDESIENIGQNFLEGVAFRKYLREQAYEEK